MRQFQKEKSSLIEQDYPVGNLINESRKVLCTIIQCLIDGTLWKRIRQGYVFALGKIAVHFQELALIFTRVTLVVDMRNWHNDRVPSKPLTLLSDFHSIAITGLPSRAINNH